MSLSTASYELSAVDGEAAASTNSLQICSNWKVWIQPLVIFSYCVVLLVFLPWWSLSLIKNGTSPYEQAVLSSAIFVILTLPLSGYQILGHILNYTKPHLQKHIIRILWMVPIYSLNAELIIIFQQVFCLVIYICRLPVHMYHVCTYIREIWISLRWPDYGLYFDIARECYEAYVIYNFMMFLLHYLFYERDLNLDADVARPSVKHIFPMCWCQPCPGGLQFIDNCRHGILQYTVIRPLTTFLAFVTHMAGAYEEGDFRFNCWFPYILLVNNASQFVAMYSLVMFYRAYRLELAPMSPVPKFLCIKAVVFFSFFQSVLLTVLVWSGIISSTFISGSGDKAQVARTLQDFLICIEMFLAALAHHWAFSHRPYVHSAGGGGRRHECCASFLAMWDVSDVAQDVQQHFRVVRERVQRHVIVTVSAGSEDRPLLSPVSDRFEAGVKPFQRNGYQAI